MFLNGAYVDVARDELRNNKVGFAGIADEGKLGILETDLRSHGGHIPSCHAERGSVTIGTVSSLIVSVVGLGSWNACECYWARGGRCTVDRDCCVTVCGRRRCRVTVRRCCVAV